MNEIHFFGEDETTVPFEGNEDTYASWLQSIAEEEGKSIESITYIFCSDDYLLEINRQYLNHDFYTDIITFPYQEGDTLESDIFISIDRVKDNANQFGVSFEIELSRVMAHGLLHLIGYDDTTDELTAQMRTKENYYLSKLA
ncbi:MAG: rRNA maturation RNase YbeY [Saprospiraceae bacterium]|nr:MAG: metalloprotein [Bacteroidetes bacterium OLB9]MCO6463448.1 rRNA maturation RNase YbeY [Saprospiraceae bacterium]MCZ2338812.1 rRNA maturation RNase YbeY [Chitinophagales bacterium]